MDKKLLDILCCPSSKQSISLLSKADLVLLNSQISAGQISQLDGQTLHQTVQEALITQDRKLIYRIEDGIPVLLTEEAIASSQIANFSA
jgi:uncharacterized protein YbaR (Trm112 family)